MASTYTPLGVELQATGENAGTWVTKTNTNLSLISQLFGGFNSQSIAGGAQTTALTVVDGNTTGTAQHRMVEFTGSITGNQIVTIPLDVETFYILRNSTSGAYTVQFKYVSGSGDSFTFTSTNKGDQIIFAAANDGTNPDIVTVNTGITASSTDTLTNKTLTAPKFADGGFIADANGNESVVFGTTSSAVNEVKITNAATGNDPLIAANGGDTNIDLAISPKGSGELVIGTGSATGAITTSGAYDLVLDTNSGTNSGSITITDGANGNINLAPNGTGQVQAGGAQLATMGKSIAMALIFG